MPFRSFLAVAPVLALMVSPLSLAAQMTRPMTAAPYETKMRCAAFRVYLASIEFPAESEKARVQAKLWIEAVFAERPDKENEIEADFESETLALRARVNHAFQSGGTIGGEARFNQLIYELDALCAQFGG